MLIAIEILCLFKFTESRDMTAVYITISVCGHYCVGQRLTRGAATCIAICACECTVYHNTIFLLKCLIRECTNQITAH